MHRGYLALWRKLSDHPLWKEKREFSKAEAWIDILWEAQHKEEPQEVLLGMTCLICNYGESLKSLETWSKRWGWNKSRVRRFLHLLENMNQIRHTSERKTTRITILNYKQYDPKRNANDTQVKRQRNDSETIATPDKNVKNVKKDKKDITTDEQKAFASHIAQIASARREANVTPSQLLSWANTIRLMMEKDKVSSLQITNVLGWYEKNWMNDFVPVVSSAGSFREKWIKLLNAIDRAEKPKKGDNHNGFDSRDYKDGASSDEQISAFLDG